MVRVRNAATFAEVCEALIISLALFYIVFILPYHPPCTDEETEAARGDRCAQVHTAYGRAAARTLGCPILKPLL